MLKIVIVGRPNVGKSTLFNKLCKKKKAIVHNFAGVTRDVKSSKAFIDNKEFLILDTAGLEDRVSGELEKKMVGKTLEAIEDADAVIFMIDVSNGVSPEDKIFANIIRKYKKPVLLLANKYDIKKSKENIIEAYSLGLGEPKPFSAEASLGFSEIKEFIEKSEEELKDILKDRKAEDNNEEGKYIKLSIIGRPNVGKSTLINSMLGKERFITADIAGTTRDSVEEFFTYKDYKFKVIDTAGIRKKSKTSKENLEQMTVQQSFENIRFSDMVILLIDATRNVDKQDLIIADYAVKHGRGLIVVINKWDLVSNSKEKLNEIKDKFQTSFHQIKDINFITISALKKKGIEKVLDFSIDVFEMFNTEISTGKLNTWLKKALNQNPPPLSRLKRPMKLKYITQTAKRPPSFTIFAGGATELPNSYINYLKNSIMKEFRLFGISVRFNINNGDNPYDKKD